MPYILKINYLVLFSGILFCTKINAQFSEFGGGIGGTNVRSDIGPVNLSNTRIGVNAFYRYNLSHIWVAKAELKYLQVASKDRYYDNNLSNIRKYEFTNNIAEISLNMEFNFLNFRYLKDEHLWSPFLTAGIANYSTFGSSFGGAISPFNFSIPFGFGIKYKLSDYWNLGFVYTASKTFNEKIDNITDATPANYSDKVRGNDSSTNDWYHYAGFTISYTIYKLKCPTHLEDESAPEYWQRHFR